MFLIFNVFRRSLRATILFLPTFSVVVAFSATAQADTCRPPSQDQSIENAPLVLYTDIQSGPTSGGERNNGIYLSIFGKYFGKAEELGRTTIVLIGGHPVATYLHLGVSRGRPDIQQLSVQVGPLGGAQQGVPLHVIVQRGHRRSNANLTFTPNPGNIYFADNVRGYDSTARAGDIAHPYRFVQTKNPNEGGIWPQIKPGDFIVLRGTGTPWQDQGFDGYFVRMERSGTPPKGRIETGPITFMGYPNEDVFLNETYAIAPGGAFAGINGPHGMTHHRRPGKQSIAARKREAASRCEQNSTTLCTQWITIADLRVEGGGHDGPVNLEIGGNHWRVVNNTLTAKTAPPSARAGGITGDGLDAFLVGNTVSDIDSPDPGLQNHGIYIDGPGSYRIEYNYIHDVPGGSGFQMYGDETPTELYITNDVNFNHNWIDHVEKYCINLADNSGRGFKIFDNVSSFCGMAGLRIHSPHLRDAKIYNNTFYATDMRNDPHYGAIVIDSFLKSHAAKIRDNIFVPKNGTPYMGGDAPVMRPSATVTFRHNLYSTGAGAPTFEVNPIVRVPDFVDAAACDFHLQLRSDPVGYRTHVLPYPDDFDFDLQQDSKDEPRRQGAYIRNKK